MDLMYAKYIKRLLDLMLSLTALVLLSPLLVLLALIGAIVMRGNPFFTQTRPGRNEKLFMLIKFRTMSNAKDKDGNLLSDDVRLNSYGKFLRSTSLDESPELLNVLLGEMSIVGPRPLLVEYLPYYTKNERHRHDMRPGLTGWAQINGRNVTEWNIRLQQDVYYVNNCSLLLDIKIIILTIHKVINRSDIFIGKEIKVGRLDYARKGK